MWAVGQAVSPIVSLSLYSAVGAGAPWVAFALAKLAEIAAYKALGVPLFPPPPPKGPPVAAAVAELAATAK